MTRRTVLGAGIPWALAGAGPEQDERIAALCKRRDPVTWLFTGDSITHGAAHTFGWRSYSEHIAERLRWEMRRVRDTVINTGISGDRLHRMNAEIDQRVLRFQPDFVSAMFGMNDCLAGAEGRAVFREALGVLHRRVSDAGALLLLHTPNLIHYPADPARGDLAAYASIVREFAASNKVALVDHYQHWSETRKTPYSLLVLLADAAIHPNQYGHIELAHLTLKKMGAFDPRSSVGRLYVP